MPCGCSSSIGLKASWKKIESMISTLPCQTFRLLIIAVSVLRFRSCSFIVLVQGSGDSIWRRNGELPCEK